jgi:hypothetical protein
MNTITLYHSTNNENLKKIDVNAGEYSGIFCSDEDAGHGKYLYTVEIEDNILHMQYADYEIVKASALKYLNVTEENEEALEKAIDALMNSELDLSDEDLRDAFKACDEEDYEAHIFQQKVQALIALYNNFSAVAVRDEHGTSYIVVDENAIIAKAE